MKQVSSIRSEFLQATGMEKLKGNRDGQFRITINMQWRICFRWEDGNAYDVEVVDYPGAKLLE